MVFTNPIRGGGLPLFGEGSAARSLRDSDSAGLQWKKASKHGRQTYADTENLKLIMWKLGRLRLHRGGSGSDGMIYKGEWDATKSYSEQNVVSRGALGEFIVMQKPPVGTAPETGSPYWHGWSYPAPGMWG